MADQSKDTAQNDEKIEVEANIEDVGVDSKPLEDAKAEADEPKGLNFRGLGPVYQSVFLDVMGIRWLTKQKHKLKLTFAWLTDCVPTLLFHSILIPILPYYTIHFGAGAFELGVIMAVFSAGAAPPSRAVAHFTTPEPAPFCCCRAAAVVGTYVAGSLSDTHGRKPLIVVSIAGTAVGFVLQALCWNLDSLYAARVWGGIFANSLPIAQAHAPRKPCTVGTRQCGTLTFTLASTHVYRHASWM